MKRRLLLLCLLLGFAVQWVMAAPPQPETFRVKQLDYGWIQDIAWSPDGQTLAVAAEKGIFLLNKNYEEIGLLSNEFAKQRDLAWNFDGTRLAVVNSEKYDTCYTTLWRGTVREAVLAFCGRPVWGNRTNWLASIGMNLHENTVALLNPDSGNYELQRFSSANDAAFAPDDRLLAYASADNHLTIWNLEAATVEHAMQAGGNSVSWSPDGAYLLSTIKFGEKYVYIGGDQVTSYMGRAFNAIYIWDAKDWQSRAIIEVTDATLTVIDTVWLDADHILTPCYSIYATIVDEICIWQRGVSSELRHITLGDGSSSGILHELSPDRRYFTAWFYWEGINLRVGQVLPLDDVDRSILLRAIAAAWSPDSRFITAVDEEGWLYEYRVVELDSASE
jgi:WD40 repeat protein